MISNECQIRRMWLWFFLRGCLAVIFGFIALFWPFATIMTLVVVWGVFVFLEGGASLYTFLKLPTPKSSKWSFLGFGIISLLAGLIAFFWPLAAAVFVIYLIAFWAFFSGIAEIASGLRLGKEGESGWFLIMRGVLSLLLGILLIVLPGAGLLVMSWIIGFYALLSGSSMIGWALQMRKADR